MFFASCLFCAFINLNVCFKVPLLLFFSMLVCYINRCVLIASVNGYFVEILPWTSIDRKIMAHFHLNKIDSTCARVYVCVCLCVCELKLHEVIIFEADTQQQFCCCIYFKTSPSFYGSVADDQYHQPHWINSDLYINSCTFQYTVKIYISFYIHMYKVRVCITKSDEYLIMREAFNEMIHAESCWYFPMIKIIIDNVSLILFVYSCLKSPQPIKYCWFYHWDDEFNIRSADMFR